MLDGPILLAALMPIKIKGPAADLQVSVAPEEREDYNRHFGVWNKHLADGRPGAGGQVQQALESARSFLAAGPCHLH